MDDLQRIRDTGLVILGHRGLSPHTGQFVNIPDHGYMMEKQGTTRTAIERHPFIRFWPCPQAPHTHPLTHTTTTILTQPEWGQTRVCITRYEKGVDLQFEGQGQGKG